MINKTRIWLLTGALLALVGCAGGNRAGITFDASVPSDQKAIIEDDLSFLASIQMPAPSSANELAYIGVGDFSPESLFYFLSQRIKYVVGEGFDYETKTQKIARTGGGGGEILVAATEDIHTIMTNLGGGLYLDGKETNYTYYINLAAQPNLAIVSPRVGIVQIGEGLFTTNSIPETPLNSIANRFLRIATYFHESRHSDGNGANVAFPHANCPSGKYADRAACENNINGPYAIQTILLRHFYTVCQRSNCSGTEMSGLSALIADYESRLIGGTYSDPRPETLR